MQKLKQSKVNPAHLHFILYFQDKYIFMFSCRGMSSEHSFGTFLKKVPKNALIKNNNSF